MSLPIPARLNLAIAGLQLVLLPTILCAAGIRAAWPATLLLALAYAVVMNSAYALLHEAEHNLLHPDRRVNDAVGTLLALFFPAPFHLVRQGHLLHHLQNRSDVEAFDLYFPGDNALWKHLQLYGILTGAFWIVIALANVVVAVAPRALKLQLALDRPTQALLDALNPRTFTRIRLEAAAALVLHAALMHVAAVPPLHYLAVLFGFGATWSAMQYVHHFGTERDVRRGALNLRTFALLDRIWLNHNWHLNHHLHPTAPWIHLPALEPGTRRTSLLRQYLRMWRGPRLTLEHVANRHAGTVSR